MRYTVALAIGLIFSSTAMADELLAGKRVVTSAHGQPICVNKSELQEYFLAMIKQDEDWMKQLTSCGMLKANLKIAVIEDYDSDSDMGHVIKIRAFGPRGSAVGYTLSLGLTSK